MNLGNGGQRWDDEQQSGPSSTKPTAYLFINLIKIRFLPDCFCCNMWSFSLLFFFKNLFLNTKQRYNKKNQMISYKKKEKKNKQQLLTSQYIAFIYIICLVRRNKQWTDRSQDQSRSKYISFCWNWICYDQSKNDQRKLITADVYIWEKEEEEDWKPIKKHHH